MQYISQILMKILLQSLLSQPCEQPDGNGVEQPYHISSLLQHQTNISFMNHNEKQTNKQTT